MTEVKTYYYTDGNTVRQVEQPLPDRHTRDRRVFSSCIPGNHRIPETR